MKPGMCLLEPEEQKDLEELVAKEGVFRTAQNLGINYLTLQRVLRRVPIRHETYVTMVTSFRNSEAAPPQGNTPLTDGEREAIRQHVDQLGKAHTSAALDISRPTLEKILFGATRLRPDTVAHLRKRLSQLAENPPTPEAPPPPTPLGQCPHCVGFVFEDALARWLTDVRNRRVCRELLSAAQQKRNNIK